MTRTAAGSRTSAQGSAPSSPDSEQALEAQLGPSERVLWRGMPEQGIRLRAGDAVLIPFSLLWAGFALFWEYMVVTSEAAPLFFALWGLPFVVAGLYITVGRFFVDSYQRSRTLYAVTNERILIVAGLRTLNVQSISLAGLHDVSLSERRDGSGTIAFRSAGSAPSLPLAFRGTAWPGVSRSLGPSFDLIPDVRRVFQLIRQAQQDQKGPEEIS